MGKNLKTYKESVQSYFMMTGLPAMTIYNGVNWEVHDGVADFFENAPVMQSDILQNSTRKMERLISEQLADFKKEKKSRTEFLSGTQETRRFGENLAVLVTPAKNKFGMLLTVCNRDIAAKRYEKCVKQQGKKLPFTGHTIQLAAAA